MRATETDCMSSVSRKPQLGLFAAVVLLAMSGCNILSGYTMNQQGTAYYKAGHYAMARGDFRRAAIDDPDNADYIHNLAAAMRKQGDHAAAERTYRYALDLDPGHQPSYHGLASLLKDQGRLAEASNLMHMWAETQPYAPEAHVELAWFKREMGDYAGAEQALRRALEVRPNHPTALAQLGDLYRETGQPDRAAALYQRSLHQDWLQPEVQSRLVRVREIEQWKSPQFAAASRRSHKLPYLSHPPHDGGPHMVGRLPQPVPGGMAAPHAPRPAAVAAQPAQAWQPTVHNADPAHAPQVGAASPAAVSH